jgi:hypothetical protein
METYLLDSANVSNQKSDAHAVIYCKPVWRTQAVLQKQNA